MIFIVGACSVLGAFISCLIELFLFKSKNPLVNKVCGVEKENTCSAVLNSDYSKITKRIHVADITLVYFAWQILFFSFSLINSSEEEFLIALLLPCSIAFVVTFFSFWYQAVKIKSLCKLCMFLIFIIWTQQIIVVQQFIVRAGYAQNGFFGFAWKEKILPSILTAILLLAIAAVWFLMKPQILMAKEVEGTRRQLLRWRQNPQFFAAVLKQQKKISDEIWTGEFLIGDASAPIRLITATNPYCPACANEYRILADIFKKNSDKICLVFRFLVDPAAINKRTEAVKYLLYAYTKTSEEKREKILGNWFLKPDINILKKEYYNAEVKNIDLLIKHQQWFKESAIIATPTLFVNGFDFPKPFGISDLRILIPQLSHEHLG